MVFFLFVCLFIRNVLYQFDLDLRVQAKMSWDINSTVEEICVNAGNPVSGRAMTIRGRLCNAHQGYSGFALLLLLLFVIRFPPVYVIFAAVHLSESYWKRPQDTIVQRPRAGLWDTG